MKKLKCDLEQTTRDVSNSPGMGRRGRIKNDLRLTHLILQCEKPIYFQIILLGFNHIEVSAIYKVALSIDIRFAPEDALLVVIIVYFKNFVTPPVKEAEFIFWIVFNVLDNEVFIELIIVG